MQVSCPRCPCPAQCVSSHSSAHELAEIHSKHGKPNGFESFLWCWILFSQYYRLGSVSAAEKNSEDHSRSGNNTTESSRKQRKQPLSGASNQFLSLYDVFQQIEKRLQLDEGKRGITEILLPEGELLHSAVDIYHSKYVAILTGFPCLLDYDPPTETDGPLGAVAIAKACLLLGKKVVLLTDECNEDVLLACTAAANLNAYGANVDSFSMESFPASFTEADEARFGELYQSIDMLISIERAGPNFEQKYLTMRKRDMTSIVAPLEYLALEASPGAPSFQLRSDIKTIGIGKKHFLKSFEVI
jgi:hypothetical protein